MVSKQKSKSKNKSKNNLPSTNELLKMYDDNSFLKNFKNKELSDLIKDKSEDDIQKNAIKIGNLIYKLIIRKMPIIVFTLMKIDNSMGDLSFIRSPVIRAIFDNKGTKLQKINQLYNYIFLKIENDPRLLFSLVKILDIKDIFDERKTLVKLSEPKVIIDIVVFFLNLRNKDKSTIDNILLNLERIEKKNSSNNLKNQIELLTTIKNCLNDSEMCEYRKISNNINEENIQEGSILSKLFKRESDSDSDSYIVEEPNSE